MSKIQSIRHCREGVEIIAIEQRGYTNKNYYFSLVIDEEAFEKIKEELEKSKKWRSS